MKKYAIIILIVVLISSSFAVYAETEPVPPKVTAEAGILIDFTTGEVLFEKNGDKKLYPASTTKVLTALIILENHELDEKVVITESSKSEGSRLFMTPKEVFTVEELLHALLVRSANDAAKALAIYHSGSVEEFASVMNTRAAELGAKNSNFVNPNGLTNKDHVSTAYDLAMISKRAMEIPKFREIVKTSKYTISPTNKQEDPRVLLNKNRFLFGTGRDNIINYKGQNIEIKYDIVDGIKTGYTDAAQQCFIGTAEKNGLRFISVVLKSEGRNIWLDTRYLLDYGFDNYKRHTFTVAGNIVDRITLDNIKRSKVTAVAKETLTEIIPRGTALSEIEKDVQYNENFNLPITENDKIGTVTYLIDGKAIASTDLLSSTTIEDTNLVTDITAFLVRTDSKNQLDYKFYLKILFNLFLSFILWRSVMTVIRVNKRKRRS